VVQPGEHLCILSCFHEIFTSKLEANRGDVGCFVFLPALVIFYIKGHMLALQVAVGIN
jgi:hypothetical protein